MSLDRLMNRQRQRNPKKITMKTILPGKLTYVGLVISLAGMIAGRFGITLPKDEINGIVTLVAANWDVIAQAGGLLTAAYGRYRATNHPPKPQIVP
jgi:hypothetical protein